MTDIGKETMKREDYPQLYRTADSLSLSYQKRHYLLLLAYLLLLIIGVVLSFVDGCTSIKITSIVVFIFSAGLYLVSKLINPVSLWYNGRAVAESVKSMTWKWMMSANPYNSQRLGTPSTDFTNDLQKLLKENCIVFLHFNNKDTDAFYTISDKMRAVREASSIQKLEFYNKQRVNEQFRWYKNKSKQKKSFYIILSSIVGICYLSIIILMIIDVSLPNTLYPIEILSIITTAIISWIEAKKYNELSSAYGLAMHDISLIKKEKLEGQVGENAVAEYVLNSETAFSREHTQWKARKNNNYNHYNEL